MAKTKNIEILRGTVCMGRRVVPGDVVEKCPNADADYLIEIGKAKEVDAVALKKAAEDAAAPAKKDGSALPLEGGTKK